MTRPICIYHGGCDDGFAGAMVVHGHYQGQVDLHPGVYGQEPPDVTGREVIMVDFSYPRAVLVEMAKRARGLTLLDHHKTAVEDLGDLHLSETELVFDMNRSGAMMAWDHFNPGKPATEFIRYIQDRDLWLKQLPDCDAFTAGLRAYPQEIPVWNQLTVPQLIEEGKVVLRFYRQKVEEVKRSAWKAKIGEHLVPVANAPYFLASEVAGELSEGAPFAVCFFETERGFTYSLRSRAGGVDVSEVAKGFGGGGHRNSAGFKSPCPVHWLD